MNEYKKPYPIMRGSPPCKGCDERYTACHDNCPKYQEWKAELYEVQKNRSDFNRKNGRTEWDLRRS